jgi:hypothetical protein
MTSTHARPAIAATAAAGGRVVAEGTPEHLKRRIPGGHVRLTGHVLGSVLQAPSP